MRSGLRPAQFLIDLQRRIASADVESALPPLMLFYTHDGTAYALIAQALADHELPPIFFLEGGVRAYTRVVTQQQMIGNGPQTRSPECERCGR